MAAIPTRRRVNPFLIGVFVLVGLAITIAIVIWLGASKFFQKYDTYVTYFDTSVEGLEPGGPVKYQGVPVGNVKTIHLAPDGKLIEVVMEIEHKMTVNDSLRVKAEIAGIAGGKFLQLFYPESQKMASLYPETHFEPPYKVIPSSPSGIEKIEIALTEIVNDLRAVDVRGMSVEATAVLRSVSGFFNSPRLQGILKNFEQSSITTKEILAEVKDARFIDNINTASDDIVKTSKQVKGLVDNVESQVRRVDSLNIPHRLDQAFAQVDSLMRNATLMANSLSYRIDHTMFTVGEAVEELKSTSRQARTSLRSITDNPSHSILSEPPPREK